MNALWPGIFFIHNEYTDSWHIYTLNKIFAMFLKGIYFLSQLIVIKDIM